jgi:hypothetical protein
VLLKKDPSKDCPVKLPSKEPFSENRPFFPSPGPFCIRTAFRPGAEFPPKRRTSVPERVLCLLAGKGPRSVAAKRFA